MSQPLTPRELAVLRARADGATTKEVAHRLGVAGQTVKNYQYSAYRKLGATTLVEAFNLLGWIKVQDDQTMAAIHETVYVAGWNAANTARDLLDKARDPKPQEATR